MTLIARTTINNVSFFLGDMLLSQDATASDQVDIPLSDDVNSLLPSNSTRSISGMRQKVNLVSDRLIVGWAGSMLQAHTIMRELRDLDAAGALDLEAVGKLIKDTPENDRNNLSLIGTILTPEPAGGARSWHFDYCAERQLVPGGEMIAAGSGAKAFTKLLPQLVTLNPPPSSQDDLYDWADGIALTSASNFVGYEMLTGQNLLDWWGGGFEIATFQHDARFAKIRDILFTFWRAIPHSSAQKVDLRFIPTLIKYDYFQDALIVQRFEGEIQPEQSAIKILKYDYRLYPPLLKSAADYDLSQFPRPELTHTALCCFVLPIGRSETGVSVYWDADKNSPFKAAVDKPMVRFSFQRRLIKDLENHTTKLMRMPASFSQIGP